MPFDEADKKALNEAIAAAVKPLIDAQAETAKNVSIFAETMAKLPPAAAAPAKPGEAKPEAGKALSLEDVAKLLDDRDAKRQINDSASAAREKFVGEQLKDLPEVYRKQLGGDPAKWGDEATKIREAFKADFKAAGGTVADVNGNAGHGGGAIPPANTLDLSKLSPTQLIAQGLKSSKPQGTANQQAAQGA